MSKRLIQIIDREAEAIAGAMELALLSITAQMEMSMKGGPSLPALRTFNTQSADVLGRVPTIFKLSWREAEGALSAALSDEQHPQPVPMLAESVEAQKLGEFALRAVAAHLEYVRADLARRYREVMLSGSARAPDNELFHRTRNGREIRSREFLLLTARQALLDYVNSIRLASLKARGASRFAVWHEDVNHPNEGTIHEIEDFPEVQREVFHPRSSCLIAREAPDASA